MDHRHRYLAAMGIQVWRLRRPLGEAAIKTPPFEKGGWGGILDNGEALADLPKSPLAPLFQRGEQSGGAGPFFQRGEQSGGADSLFQRGEQSGGADSLFQRGEQSVRQEGKEEDRTARIARLDWDGLQAEVNRCTACGLHATRTQAVFGVGDRQAQWLIIGEAPGADEDRLGEPFVGKAGKLLDAMLLALGLRREQVFIANILKSRPPNNRDPLPEEIRACWPFVERQIDLIRPKIILAVGRIAAQTLLQTEVPVGRLRGRVYRLKATDIPVVVTYHPAYLLRSPREKRKSWEDLQLARGALGEQGIPRRGSAP